jgi:hypothetical protein
MPWLALLRDKDTRKGSRPGERDRDAIPAVAATPPGRWTSGPAETACADGGRKKLTGPVLRAGWMVDSIPS